MKRIITKVIVLIALMIGTAETITIAIVSNELAIGLLAIVPMVATILYSIDD